MLKSRLCRRTLQQITRFGKPRKFVSQKEDNKCNDFTILRIFFREILREDLKKSAFLEMLDKRQSKFLQKCPDADDRLDACLHTSYGNICFYSSEWVCNGRCIGKSDVCLARGTAGKCHWGMKKCGNKCVDRHSPCNGRCWNEANPNLCGDNLCLSEYQLLVISVCPNFDL